MLPCDRSGIADSVFNRKALPKSSASSADGGDLLMFGSATTANPLLELGFVDELIVFRDLDLTSDIGVRV